MTRSLLLGLLLLASLGNPAAARADQMSFAPTQDNTIYSESDSSFGAGQCLQVGVAGRAGAPPNTRRALLLFDLRNVPTNLTIVGARLTLFQDRALPTFPVYVHRLQQAWGEGSSGASAPSCFTQGSEQGGQPPIPNSSSTWHYAFYLRDHWTT